MDMDFAHLLQTNAPPSLAEEPLLLERIRTLDGSLAELDHDLARAQRRVHELSARRTQLQAERQAYATMTSPLRRLPPDLFAEILKFAVWSCAAPTPPSTSTSTSTTSTTSSSSISALNLHGIPPPWREPHQLAILTRVCHAWTRAALSAPLLWSALDVHVSSASLPFDALAHHLETWFTRAGALLPWSLKLSSSLRQTRAPVFARFLQRHCARWRVLRVCIQDLDVLAPLFCLGPRPGGAVPSGEGEAWGAGEEWSCLEELSLEGWFTHSAKVEPFRTAAEEGEEGPSLCMLAPMPRLTSLALDMPYQKVRRWKWPPWAQLTRLELTTADAYEDYVAVLKACAALESCSMWFNPCLRMPVLPTPAPVPADHDEGSGVSEEQGEHEGGHEDEEEEEVQAVHAQAICLPHLRELTLNKISHLTPLFSVLTLPSLVRLSVAVQSMGEHESNVGAVLVDFLDRSCHRHASASSISISTSISTSASISSLSSIPSNSPLTFLSLSLGSAHRHHAAPAISNAEYVRLFAGMGALETLYLADYGTDAGFLERVGEWGLLPRLRTVAFQVEAGEEVRGRFRRFVEGRAGVKC